MQHPTPPGNPTPADSAVTAAATEAAQAFIQRWHGVAASELATSQSFVIELCALLGVEPPTHEPHYQFERPITFRHGDGTSSPGRVDCYKRGHFVWESKKLKPKASGMPTATTKAFDDALLKARQQAENYARALPAAEGRPPFLVVVDVGHVIELYAEFTRSGATYTPFPDPRSHRIRLGQLADPAIRARLQALWTDPLSLDPSRISAKVTRAVAAELADLAKSLEAAGHHPETVAAFLTRCLFSMFAEDVGLLPPSPPAHALPGTAPLGSFAQLLTHYREQPATLAQMLRVLWQGMDVGGFNPAIAQTVLRFNGKLFKGAGTDGYVLPLTTAQIDGLLRAARANWQEVEPAIFGTLLERALNPTERHALGAHYTPRAYVERLVLPTVVEPLRADWANAQAAAVLLAREAEALDGKKREAKLAEARAEIRRFHHQLCATRVLDPACGSGNFLYVTLEHLKRLEGEVINQLEALGETQDKLGLEGETVTLKQLRGMELNARAAALAELVLWIGWLQWHVRTRGLSSVAEPVVHDYRNIENRDAVLAFDRAEPAQDVDGQPLTRWDGVTFKKHPVTGEDVPDETAQTVQWAYVNPRPAQWPEAEFIVGNPPFIGKLKMREALGDGYVVSLRDTYVDVPDSADFVMYWWHKAASLVAQASARQFGFITTNSLTMTYNRRVVEAHLQAKKPVHLRYAIPDHPWVDSAQGAAVRIAMTVGAPGSGEGSLHAVVSESDGDIDALSVVLSERTGVIHANLVVGTDVTKVQRLRSNSDISAMGMILVGSGFIVEQGDPLLLAEPERIKPYLNGKDLTQRSRGVYVIDMYGLKEDEVRQQYPACYQRLYERVKPERNVSNDKTLRELWWLFRRTNIQLRSAISGLSRYIGTTETAKHRLFSFISGLVTPDQKIRVVGSDDALLLGVLSSSIHVEWTLKVGGTLEDRPVYNNTICFEPFPFPHEDTGLSPELAERIRRLAEQLDAHRKARQAAFESVTLTGLYNVLDKLRRGEALSAKDKTLHEQGLVSVLQSLHDELDAAVLAAYGWSDLGPVPWRNEAARATWTETLLARLVALNAQRAAEEASGTVRWLRPSFQDPAQRALQAQPAAEPPAPTPTQTGIEGLESAAEAAARTDTDTPDTPHPSPAQAASPEAWPATLPEQMRAVAQRLQTSPTPLNLAAIEASFKGKGPWKKGLPRILETLEALGRARQEGGGWRG
ncbi:MAG: hypothetical protein RLZZ352_2726 [Pseudomonadota bacterium]|jgi:hypothetical protein